ncbi:hypothetical protein SKAU_G00291520 [Synaphobranchus kaupii]|uniref:Uncharacterized protein n=1 Tax=Synaphobranchus kaupii TaxID=118154 RepID=A0A9Q1EU02_SYNKA|nr:hypothetical protein SKAU_G00291520 [Synaphobranchus kaupii]
MCLNALQEGSTAERAQDCQRFDVVQMSTARDGSWWRHGATQTSAPDWCSTNDSIDLIKHRLHLGSARSNTSTHQRGLGREHMGADKGDLSKNSPCVYQQGPGTGRQAFLPRAWIDRNSTPCSEIPPLSLLSPGESV